MEKILGIDLGTTNSAMAIIEGGEPKIIENAEGARTTPSVVALSKSGERLVGLLAKRQAVTNPENTLFGIKRLIGHKFEDEGVQRDDKTTPFTIQKSEDGGVKVKMGDKFYRPEEISAMIIQKLKADAEAHIGEKITEAVITVPAYFDDAQRKATKNAGEIAGFNVRRVINEPTAAALAYGFSGNKDEKIAVFDFGGGTFDVSVLEISEDTVEVKSTDGDVHMGGEDIDQKIIGWIAEEFKKESGVDVTTDVLALQRLREAGEKAKVELSTATEAEINIPFITSDASGPRHLLLKLTRAKLEDLAREYIDRSIEITKRAIEASPFSISEIDEIVLVGGQTRMPAIIKAVEELFGKEPNRSINPDEVVATGAAIQAGVLQGDVKDVLLLDVIPLSFGIETMGGVATKLLEKNTTIPASKSQTFSTAADNQTSVEIHVVQGERTMVSDNKTLGKFILDSIPPSPRGMPQIDVEFNIDANGILSVKATDKASGKEQSIKIEARGGLSEDEIARMKEEALAHEEEDKVKREIIEVKNTAEQLAYTAEKALKDAGDKVPEDIKKTIEEKITAVRAEKEKEPANLDEIKRTSQELGEAMQKIGEAMQASSAQADKGEEGAQAGEGENVRDAEYKEKSEEDTEEGSGEGEQEGSGEGDGKGKEEGK